MCKTFRRPSQSDGDKKNRKWDLPALKSEIYRATRWMREVCDGKYLGWELCFHFERGKNGEAINQHTANVMSSSKFGRNICREIYKIFLYSKVKERKNIFSGLRKGNKKAIFRILFRMSNRVRNHWGDARSALKIFSLFICLPSFFGWFSNTNV